MYKSKKRKLQQLSKAVFTQKEYIEKKNKGNEEETSQDNQQKEKDIEIEQEEQEEVQQEKQKNQDIISEECNNNSNVQSQEKSMKAKNKSRHLKQVKDDQQNFNSNKEKGEDEKKQENVEEEESKFDQKFEDEFDDEYEEEDIVQNEESDNEDWENIDENDMKDENDSNQGKVNFDKIKLTLQKRLYEKNQKKKSLKAKQEKQGKAFMGTDKDLQKGEFLDYENRAYEMFHQFSTEWPCLSCDFLLPSNQPYNHKNRCYQKMDKYPYTIYAVAGTSKAEKENLIYLMKATNLRKTKYDDDSEEDESDEENENENEQQEPELQCEQIPIKFSVNRIRSLNYLPIVAAWCENGDFIIADLKKQFQSLENRHSNNNNKKGFYNKQHQNAKFKVFKNKEEGFALDWNKLKMGHLLSGSCEGKIYAYAPSDLNFSDILRDETPYTYHNGSVEDVQWSCTIETCFASCSTDKTLQICDTRSNNKKKSEILINAHDCDINVISWNEMNDKQIVTGADDGSFKVWDIKYPDVPYSEIHFHNKPITSIQFQPTYDSSIAVTSEDNRLTIWDLAVENDDQERQQSQQNIEKNEEAVEEEEEEIPQNLMFIHGGQTEMKELRFHPIYYELILSTANNGFHIFKPALDELPSEESSQNNDEVNVIKESELEKYFSEMSLQDKKN